MLNNSPLTKIELDLVKNSQNSYINEACCYCCCANVISEIIKRKFYRCYKCYCCCGDTCIDEDTDVYICEHNNVDYVELRKRSNNLKLNFNEEYQEYDEYKFKKTSKRNISRNNYL